MKTETRAVFIAPELRGRDGGKLARGYAALFDSPAIIAEAFSETIAPGAFADTIKASDVRALIDHDTGRVIGRSSAGTLRLSEDDKGLVAEIDLPDTSDGRDLAVQLARGDISGMSFGFRVTHEEWDDTGNMPQRIIRAVDLFEVSAVAFPAYEDTEIALRSLEKIRDSKEEGRRNAEAAQRRILARKAKQEMAFRRINTGPSARDGEG